ncbi:MAG TPA: hypothetical protein VII63_00290 [Caulobacteraceae bacterium]
MSEPARAVAPSPPRRVFLRYWSLNVALARQAGWGWIPGFTYSQAEQRRMGELAAAIDQRARITWLAATALIFILAAAAMMTAALGTALTLLWPHPGDIPEAGFFALLALVMVLSIAIGLPLSIFLGGALADWAAPAPRSVGAPGDGALEAKVRAQFARMAVILGVLFTAAAFAWWALLGRPR